MKHPTPVLLAGGSGKRFAPFVSDKLLWPLMGRPLVSQVIEPLESAGFSSIIVITNKENDVFFRSLSKADFEVKTVIQTSQGGMSAALSSAKGLISKEPILVLNTDDIFESSLIKSVVDEINHKSPSTLFVGLERADLLPVGYLNIVGDQVKSIVEKPSIDKKPSNYVKLVMDYFSDSDKLYEYLEKTPFPPGTDSHYEDTLNNILMNEPASFIPYTGYWNKLKYPHFVLDVMEILMGNKLTTFVHPKATISPSAIVEDGVYIDDGAKIEAGAVVKGKTYIGRGVIVGNNALVRSSFIEERSTVGYGSEVARSYVGPRCQIHHSFIGDSVLESDINMSWGTVTANLRLDGKAVSLKHPNGQKIQTGRTKLGAMIAKGSFLGINTSTMPGICIGANTQTLPGTVVKKTI